MSLELIDAHSHLNFPQFDADREAVFARAAEAGVGMINVGTDLATSKLAVGLVQNRENVWATVGLHPTDSGAGFNTDSFLNLAKNDRVVAIGECGLDYFRSDPETASQQKEIFVK